MSAFTSCPKCSGRVTLPENAGESAWVRCPICEAEYPLRRVLEYRPPALELIDEPAAPSEGRVPSWDAVAAPVGAETVGVASEIAAVASDAAAAEASEVITSPAFGVTTERMSSAEVAGESEVITFDDSLLLDEPTVELLPVQSTRAAEGIAPAPVGQQSDEDFFNLMSNDSARDNQENVAEAIDWTGDDMREPHEQSSGPNKGAEANPFRLAGENGGSSTFEPTRAGVGGGPSIGLPPRQRTRRTNPIVMVGGIVGGGVLGLAIGYAILMWGFSKDPFALATKLPDVLVPASLRPARIAQNALPNDGTNANDSSSTGVAADATATKSGDPFSFGGDTGTTNSDSNTNAVPNDSLNQRAPDAKGADEIEPSSVPTINPFADTAKSTPGASDASAAKTDSLPAQPFPPQEDTKDGKAKTGAIETPVDPFGQAKTDAAKTDSAADAAKDPFADPFGESAKSDTKTAAAAARKDQPETVGPEPRSASFAPKTDAADGKEATVAAPAEATSRWTNVAESADATALLGATPSEPYTDDRLKNDVQAAKQTTSAALSLAADAAQKEKNEANFAYYVDLTKVAEAFTFLEPSKLDRAKGVETQSVIDALTEAVPNRERLEELGKLAGYWFKAPRGNGIVLSGLVKESKEQGKLFVSSVETLGKPASGKPATITVVSPWPLTSDPNHPVLVAGVIVENPPKSFPDYAGDADKVVWAAIALDPVKPSNNVHVPSASPFK